MCVLKTSMVFLLLERSNLRLLMGGSLPSICIPHVMCAGWDVCKAGLLSPVRCIERDTWTLWQRRAHRGGLSFCVVMWELRTSCKREKESVLNIEIWWSGPGSRFQAEREHETTLHLEMTSFLGGLLPHLCKTSWDSVDSMK